MKFDDYRSLCLSLFLSLAIPAYSQTPAAPDPAKFPALNVQATVGTQQRPVKNSSYRKTMTIIPKVTIEGTSRMVPIPATEARMLIITMDTRLKYESKVEAFKVHTAETVKIPAAERGDRRTFAFAESAVTYDSYRDASNIGGSVYKYFVFGLRDPATKTVVDFKTNHQQLLAYVKANPEKRDEILNLAAGTNFPADFK